MQGHGHKSHGEFMHSRYVPRLTAGGGRVRTKLVLNREEERREEREARRALGCAQRQARFN